LMGETLAGARAALDARDRLIGQAARVIERAAERAGGDGAIPAISPRLLLGATSRLLATRLDRGERCLAGLDAELCAWLQSYSLPAALRGGRLRSTALRQAPAPLISTRLRPPPALSYSPGRGSDGALSENQWLRIVFATAEIVTRDGYGAATVAEITRAAGLDNRAFYRLFACKEQALADARELMFGHTMALTAGAFATAEAWPERVWAAAQAFVDCVEQNPTLAYVSFVESHAGGPVAMARLPQLIGAFTIFLQEGYRSAQGDSAQTLSPVALEATVTAAFELCHLRSRGAGPDQAGSQLQQLAFLCLAPFLGAVHTRVFLRQRCARESRASDAAREPLLLAHA
jgi:AcrR family transcriptional regulator